MSERDPTDIVGQEKAERDARDRVARMAELEADDFKWVMSNKRGRRFIWRLLDKAGVYRSSFTGNSETFFREGARNLGLQVLAMIHEHAPDGYTLMLSEQKEYERTYQQRSNEH